MIAASHNLPIESIGISHRPRRLCLICKVPTFERYSLLLGELLDAPPGNAENLNVTIDLAICSRHFHEDIAELRDQITGMPGFEDYLNEAKLLADSKRRCAAPVEPLVIQTAYQSTEAPVGSQTGSNEVPEN